jgi:citrate synthase
MSVDTGTYSKGLEEITADETTASRLDGQKGKRYHRGYGIEDLAAHSDFEEVTYLLLYEKLPAKPELDAWRKRMRASRNIPSQFREMIRAFLAGQNLGGSAKSWAWAVANTRLRTLARLL